MVMVIFLLWFVVRLFQLLALTAWWALLAAGLCRC